jgi:transcriptional regulator with XRE-family HTH domain
MNSIGKKISDARKLKGFTQEELAELSKVNLRTIQRIENNNNEPRGKTLSLICDVLQIDKADLQGLNQLSENKTMTSYIINGIFLILLNILIVETIGYLTLPNEANTNSKVGAILLSFFIPLFIVHFTQKIRATQRLLKFGIGFAAYLLLLICVQGFIGGCRIGFRSWIFSCILIFIGVLFYGEIFYKPEK